MAISSTADLLRRGLSGLMDRRDGSARFDAGPAGSDGRIGTGWNCSPALLLLDQMPVGLAVYDDHGRLAHSNPHFGRLVSSSQMPSHRAGPRRWAGWGADGAELSPDQFPCERALRGETVSPGVELLHYGRDGSERWLTVSASPITDPDREEPLGIVLFFAESLRVPASGDTAAMIRMLGRFADGSGNGVWVADVADGDFEYRNTRHLELSGDPDAARLSDWLSHLPDTDRPRVRRCHEAVRAGGVGHVEYALAGRDGQARRVRETCFPIRDGAGRIMMIAGIVGVIAEAACVRPPVFVVGDPAAMAGGGEDGPATRFADLAGLMNVADFLLPGCVVVDVATCPDADTGLARALARLPRTLPVIVLGRPDTHAATAIAAMRAGAVDYLIPPLAEDALSAALAGAAAAIPQAAPPAEDPGMADRLGSLTKREREVLTGLMDGGTNKSIARALGISPRTVELHRAHLMERMNVPNLATLLRVAQQCVPR